MITVVIPTIGRPCLADVLAALAPAPPDARIIVVDDRPGAAKLLKAPGAEVLRTGGKGPAAARNAGWRAARTPWVAFLDDDVIPQPGWWDALRADLTEAEAGTDKSVAASQARLHVPLPAHRRPTDAERNTAGLAAADWITADIAYRREALQRVGGFDERFPRAYREDADLALRVAAAGYRLVKGRRVTRHPVRDDGPWASVLRQRGNADDALMRQVHGPAWRSAIGAPGRLREHALTTAAGLLAVSLYGAILAGRSHGRRTRRVAALAALTWLGLTAEFAWARLAPGPRTTEEIRWMSITSVLIPPVACAWRLRGELRARRGARRTGEAA
ncbi:transferase [Spongiactinospora gelatinilytica]|uniref:Transferase n=1 Tax=Spongiactinospora gelatinilytica TaxID=2666298 RepID=A0A2W2I4R7_9ACTN|nr:glycosyltransferase [Spongiactinospora gelatinilytica]PZG57098.1 transferase [Spongiactinospora gelatinilytica]